MSSPVEFDGFYKVSFFLWLIFFVAVVAILVQERLWSLKVQLLTVDGPYHNSCLRRVLYYWFVIWNLIYFQISNGTANQLCLIEFMGNLSCNHEYRPTHTKQILNHNYFFGSGLVCFFSSQKQVKLNRSQVFFPALFHES